MTTDQLRQLGLTAKAIKHRVARGLLVAVFHGVYAVGHLPTNPIDAGHGVLLATGPRSALSHGSAAAYWGINRRWPSRFHVTSAIDRRPAGIVVHHRKTLLRSDIVGTPERLRVTSPALTLLDIAPGLSHYRLTRAVNHMRIEHRVELEAVRQTLARFRHQAGAAKLLRIVGEAPNEPGRSDWELDWHPFAAKYALPAYETNVKVCGYRVDVHFPGLLVVEMDGWGTHGTRDAFEKDRDQDPTILAETGMPTVRVTRRRLRRQPAREAARLHAILAERRRLTG